MIERIQIQGFKSLADVAMELGPFNLLIGPNASGKSNFLEALRVLQGLAFGFTVDEVLNGKSRSATGEVWEGVRGGSKYAGRGNSVLFRKEIRLAATLKLTSPEKLFRYSVALAPQQCLIVQERLEVGKRVVFEAKSSPTDPKNVAVSGGSATLRGKFSPERSVLAQWDHQGPAHEDEDVTPESSCNAFLRDVQRLDLSPDVLRSYSSRHGVRRMGDRGEDFAAVVEGIAMDPVDKAAYEEWLRRLTPNEIDTVKTMRGPQDEAAFSIKQGKSQTAASSLSDGTLRFAAIAAAFFQKDVPKILLLEEIENGIHPPRLRVMLDLLRSQSERTGAQVFATTHSPVVLDWLTPEDRQHTFWFRRNEESGATEVTPLSKIPSFEKLLKKHPASELFTEGWLETVR